METFEGDRWEGALTASFQLFSPTLRQDEGNVGNRGEGRGRMVLCNEMLLREVSIQTQPILASASYCLRSRGQKE